MKQGIFSQLMQNRGFCWYAILFAVFLTAGACVLLTTQYGDVVLLVNRLSRMTWDKPMDWITRIGLGSTGIIVALGLTLYKFRNGLMMLCNIALTGLFTALFKQLLFPDIVRPLKYFEADAFYRMVRLYDYNLLHSFPSGHTMTIFAVTSLLAYFTAKRTVSVLLMALACLVGLSRIYLCQHFFIDVYFGAIMGMFCTISTIWLGDYVVKLKANRVCNSPFLLRQIRQNFTALFW